MKKILVFVTCILIGICRVDAAVRDGNTVSRQSEQPTQKRISTVKDNRSSTARGTVLIPSKTTVQTVTSRSASGNSVRPSSKNSSARSATTTNTQTVSRAATTGTPRTTTKTASPRQQTQTQSVISRAATQSSAVSATRTGAEYEQCKTAFFTCMDQFCKLKNDDYRRCSCSNRVYKLTEVRDVMQQAGDQLTVFTENLDVVGMTAAQATAMKTASEGENALTADTSASKALLQAIMNSIRGEDSSVGGKYESLNSINLSFDTTNAFGISDAGQAIAAYNGQNLYSAVYPQCRQAVKTDCNDASLQRAINAYLMAIEQDCNTVQTAIEEKQKQMKSAVREGSAMLDLARVENRQKHNSDSISACLNNVESAILSEEVCGAGYHKCLDNGEFIDISTGKPIAGVEKFYELANLLTFASGVEAADQKLSKISNNRTFVQNFEKRVKKFAEPALDKCTEQADEVWAEYLDKAMLDIYYAQQSKVSEIKQGCFDFISSCYMNGDAALTAAMKELTGDSGVVLQPDKVALNAAMCKDYVQSCDNMFDGNIIAQYIENQQSTNTLTACRAVVKQCFDKYGSTGYENFYYPYSGIFKAGYAPDWFTLYELTGSDTDGKPTTRTYKSECAKQLAEIDSCNDEQIIEQAFGGFDTMKVSKGKSSIDKVYYYNPNPAEGEITTMRYGLLNNDKTTITDSSNTETKQYALKDRSLRPTGVATELYNQIIDILSTQCMNVQGRFIETQFIKDGLYKDDNFCTSNFDKGIYNSSKSGFAPFATLYGIGTGEDMCPRDYALGVDTQSWGACLCWENGGRRSKWGKSAKCVAAMPVAVDTSKGEEAPNDANCPETMTGDAPKSTQSHPIENWCTQPTISNSNQVCPLGWIIKDGSCSKSDETTPVFDDFPDGISI